MLSLQRPLFDRGQVRRPGIPRLNRSHPMASGMQIAMLDIGGRVYDFARGNTVFNGLTRPARGQSPYGTGFNWPGSGGTTLSYGCYERVGFVLDGVGGNPSVDPESQVSVFSNLGGLGAGAGFSFATAFYLTDASFGEQFIFGRPSRAQEAPPFVNWSLQARNAGDGGVGIAYFYANNGTLNQCGGGATIGSNNVPYNAFQYTSCAATNVNTSSGSAVCTQFQQGKQVNQSSSVDLLGTNTSNGVDGESQLMMGSIYHVDTTQAFQCASGFVYYGYVWNRALTPEEVRELHYHPYCMFKWPEDEFFDNIVGTASSGISVNPSGAQATCGVGAVSFTDSFTISGASLTASAGSVTETRWQIVSVSGAQVVASAGSVTETLGQIVSVSGAQAVASAGSVTETSGQTVSVSGAQATVSAGSVTETRGQIVSVSGAQVVASVGTETISESVSVSGASVTASAGAVTISFLTSLNVNVTGAQASASAGSPSISDAATQAVTGAQANAQVGSEAASVSISLAGAAALGLVGALISQIVVRPSGAQAVALAGHVTLEGTIVFKPPTPPERIIKFSQEVRTIKFSSENNNIILG